MKVSDACQINDFDHRFNVGALPYVVSDACQINDFDHAKRVLSMSHAVSDACQINDFDHSGIRVVMLLRSFRCLSDQ